MDMDSRPQRQKTDVGQPISDRNYETISDPVNSNRSGHVQEEPNAEHPYEETSFTAVSTQTKGKSIVEAKSDRDYETIPDKHNGVGSGRKQESVDTEHPYEETTYQVASTSKVRGTAQDGAYESAKAVREQKIQLVDDGEYEIAQPSTYGNM